VLGAPVAPPLPGVGPVRHRPTGFTVTLWTRLDHKSDDIAVPGSMVGQSPHVLHDALSICDLSCPASGSGWMGPDRLHGEPHPGNYVSASAGLRWIDLESVCRGPLEWDLAFLPATARELFSDVDRYLLSLLEMLNSARVATWCWVQARFPEMRRHGEHHLGVVLSGMG
jgi:hypothetical protein